MTGIRTHAVGLFASALCAAALAGCALTAAGGPSGSGKAALAACSLLSPSEVSHAFGASVGAGLPEQNDSLDPPSGPAPGCNWPLSQMPSPTASSPRPAITPGASASPPSGGGGVVVWLNNADFGQLRTEVGRQDGSQKGTAVAGLGDEAIMLAIGDDWRQLYIRKGSTTVSINLGRPGLVGPMLEAAERAIGSIIIVRI